MLAKYCTSVAHCPSHALHEYTYLLYSLFGELQVPKANLILPLVNTGMWRCACMTPTESNPWCASTMSPGKRCDNILQCSVRCLSLTRPPHDSDTRATTPWGIIPNKIFTVFLCLQLDHVAQRASKFEGCSIKTSKQSMIIATFHRKILESIWTWFYASHHDPTRQSIFWVSYPSVQAIF